MSRYFTITPAAYSSARAELDLAFGHPNGKAETTLPPEPVALTPDGKALVAIRAEFAQWPEVAPLLAGLLASGEAVEINQEEYFAALPHEEM